MKDTYLSNQNVSNNIIITSQRQNSLNKKKKLLSSEKSISYSSSVDDKNETIDNQINDSTSSFDYADTLKVEKNENFLSKGKNLLKILSKAISENFENFNKQRKTHINNININLDRDKNKKNIILKHKRTTSENNKLEERIKNKRLVTSNQNRNRNFILNRINASKSLNNKENLRINSVNSVHKLTNEINQEKEDIKVKEIKKENKCNNIKDKKANVKNNKNKICKNINNICFIIFKNLKI